MGPGLSSLSALSALHVSDTGVAAPTRRERVLLAALLLSLAVHLLGISGAADWLSEQFRGEEPELGPPLRRRLTRRRRVPRRPGRNPGPTRALLRRR